MSLFVYVSSNTKQSVRTQKTAAQIHKIPANEMQRRSKQYSVLERIRSYWKFMDKNELERLVEIFRTKQNLINAILDSFINKSRTSAFHMTSSTVNFIIRAEVDNCLPDLALTDTLSHQSGKLSLQM